MCLGQDAVPDLLIQPDPDDRTQQPARILVLQAPDLEVPKSPKLLASVARGEHQPNRVGQEPPHHGRAASRPGSRPRRLLRDDPTPPCRYAPDLIADPAMRAVSAAFPALCAASLALPAAAGWLIDGSWRAALAALLWAGLARVALLQHVTWSVNSLCHLIGPRPYATRRYDRATNLWPLALVSFGESWHNGHHSDPTCARHGTGPHQVDISAAVIRFFERLGWATAVHWPDPARLAARRRRSGQDQLLPALQRAGR